MPLPKRLTHFLLPGGLIAGVAILLTFCIELPEEVHAFWPFYPALVLGGGLLIGWRFSRSRLIIALLVLALGDRAQALGSGVPGVDLAVRILLPLNLALVALYRERGLVTPLGLLRLGLIALQPALVGYALLLWPQALPKLLARPLLPALSGRVLAATLPQPALAALILSGAVLLLVFWWRPEPFSGGLVWALPTAFLPLVLGTGGGQAPTLGLATAGVILLAAVLESSYGMAFLDDLTGLPARRALNEGLLKVGRRYALAMVDIDHFKKVNDRHGHDVGDQVLKMVAARLARVKGGGLPFRYGGEEFTVLFPGKGAEEVLPTLDQLRLTIAAASFTLRHPSRPKRRPEAPPKRVGGARLGVTVSIGVAERCDERAQPEQVLRAADQALYRAKQTGRNRICGVPAKGVSRSRKKR